MHPGEAVALNHLDRMTDSTGLIQHAIYSVPRRGERLHDRRQRPGLAALRSSLESAPRRADVEPGDHLPEFPGVRPRRRPRVPQFSQLRPPLARCGRLRRLPGPGGSRSGRSARQQLAWRLPGVGPRVDRRGSAHARRPAKPARSSLCDPGVGASVECGGRRHRTSGNRGLVGGAATGRMLRPCPAAGLAVVRVAHDLCERGVAARPVHRRRALAARRTSSTSHRASFAFLDRQTTAEGVFWPVGNEGWYPRGEEKAPYDQQPVEAVTMAEAALAAFDLLGDEEYLAAFRRAHGWFHGRNSLKRPLVDVRSGACCDGLQASGVNRNQGAESTFAYLWAEMSNTEVLYWHGDELFCGAGVPPARKMQARRLHHEK